MRLRAAAIVVALVAVVVTACGGGAEAGVTRGPASSPVVALTFDDGLNGATTRSVASMLEAAGMRGTFFVVGQTVEGQADLGRELIAHGHAVANHSFDHRRAGPDDDGYDQLERTQAEIRRFLGVCPRYFRPPYGTETEQTRAAVRAAGMRTVLWDVEVGDWSETDASRLASNVLGKVRAGSIVLLHDGGEGRPAADRSVLLAALPMILDGLRARGLTSVGLDELLGESAYLDGC
ncbi:MAG: polysaccharide deacetylase family protein [Dehalococcoidia bacterium]